MIVQLETPSINASEIASEHRPASSIAGMVQVFTNSSSVQDPQPERKFFTNVLAQALCIAQQGTKVLVVQFLKGGINQGCQHPTTLGENLDWLRCDLQRNLEQITQTTAEATEISAIQELWQHTQQLALQGGYSLVILDELSLAMKLEFIPEAQVLDFLRDRPNNVDIIFTGAAMPQAILDIADQVTKIRRSHYV
jgi:cob(I)alamin adenosyltransferase